MAGHQSHCANITQEDIKAAAEKLEAFEGTLNASERWVIEQALAPNPEGAEVEGFAMSGFWCHFQGNLWLRRRLPP